MLIADTGFWTALGNRRDNFHQQAVCCFNDYQSEKLITTWAVMTETCHLLLNRAGHYGQQKFIEFYHQGNFDVFDTKPEHSEKLVFLMQQYADLPIDLAGASLILLAEHLSHGQILTLDKRDFSIYRWNQTQVFENLLC